MFEKTTPAMVPTRCAVIHTRRAARAVTQFFDTILQPSGLRATQFTLLVAVHQVGGMQMTDIAERLLMNRTTLTRELRLLEKEGLVSITIGQDRRVRQVSLTPNGEQALNQALPFWARAQSEIEERLGQDIWETTLARLNDLAQVVR